MNPAGMEHNAFLCLLILLAPLCSSTEIWARAEPSAIQARLEMYEQAFPNLQFLHLKTANDVFTAALLPRMLGDGAENLDYEHGEDVRSLLLEAQYARIATMLENRLPADSYRFFFRVSSEARDCCLMSKDFGRGAPYQPIHSSSVSPSMR